MKKVIMLAVLLGFFPLFAKASLMGFEDGNMYDPATSTWQCLFLMDGNCYDLNQNVLFTRPPGYVAPVIVPDTTPTQTVYVPIQTPSNQIVGASPVATGGVLAPTVPVVQKVTFSDFSWYQDIINFSPNGSNGFLLDLNGALKSETTGIATLTSKSLNFSQTLTGETHHSIPWTGSWYEFTDLQPASDYILTFTIDSPTASGTAVSGNLTIW